MMVYSVHTTLLNIWASRMQWSIDHEHAEVPVLSAICSENDKQLKPRRSGEYDEMFVYGFTLYSMVCLESSLVVIKN